MKRLLIAAAAVAAVAAPGLASAADVSGLWKVAIMAGDMTINVDCKLAQQAAALSGTCTPQGMDGAKPSAFTGGSVDGSTVKWAYDVDLGGMPLHLVWTGNVKSDTAMDGSIDAGGNAVTFSATKQ